jgi:chorismate--pyruvate lyase
MPYTTWKTLPSLAPDILYPWLTDKGSMTARLIQNFPAFTVSVLDSGLRRTHADEAMNLGLSLYELAYTREVLLCSAQRPLIYAHSATHPQWLKTHFSHLYQQANKPLGTTLFTNPRIRRRPIMIAKIRPRHRLYRKLQTVLPFSEPYLWARRSCFTYGVACLMVTEVFLPNFIPTLKAR